MLKISKRIKRDLILSAWITLAWVAINLFYSVIIVWSTESFLKEGMYAEYIHKGLFYFEGLFFGVFFGITFSIIHLITERTRLRKQSFGKIILLKTGLYLMSMLIGVVLILLFYTQTELVPLADIKQLVSEQLTLKATIGGIAFYIITIILMNFALEVNRKFGPGVLFKLLMGTYHKPKVEQRIFLFLDLKDSTTIAEKLGHKVYSRMLRTCYHEISDVVIEYDAEIYQYVGDEVVLTWPVEKGLRNLNCIKAFFAFDKILREKDPVFRELYDITPVFKGGMDMGSVTAAEIGDIKREIAYHGDVLNTASRIQDQCRTYHKSLLISERVECEIPSLNGFTKEMVGDILLRGKHIPLKVFSIEQK